MALDAGKSFEDAVVRIKRKTAVVVKKHQLTTVHLTRPPIRAWCGSCRVEVLMLTVDEASALAQTDARNIFRRVEAGELHFSETERGALLVCAASLGLNLTE